MSGLPNPLPPASENESVSSEIEGSEFFPAEHLSVDSGQPGLEQIPSPVVESALDQSDEIPRTEPPEPGSSDTIFESYGRPSVHPPRRIPNVGDLAVIVGLLAFGFAGSGTLFALALHFHIFGVSTVKQAVTDIRYTLGSQVAWYFIALLGCLLLFPAVWNKGFFAGLQWGGARALRMRGRLISAALACFVLAIADGILLPGPTDTPIDQMFRIPGAAWTLFAFGVTLAPFFEEIAFRGFLLPALCTAYDWIIERLMDASPRWPDEDGHPRWSIPAMVVGSLLTSVPFALMHAEQTGYSLGPFLLLICVSLVLCWVRLSTRSLAASVLVHSSYNLLLFSLMLAGTGGFKHLDRM